MVYLMSWIMRLFEVLFWGDKTKVFIKECLL